MKLGLAVAATVILTAATAGAQPTKPPPAAPAKAAAPAPPPPPAAAPPAAAPPGAPPPPPVAPPGAPPPPPGAPPAAAKQPAFPPPKAVAVTEALKCAWGAIESNGSGQIVVDTPAGNFTVSFGDAQLFAEGGKAQSSALRPEQNVRVYYLVKDGAQALEIDLIPAAAPAPPK